MERVQSPVAPTEELGQGPSLAPFEPPPQVAAAPTRSLEELAHTARNSPGQVGRDAHAALHQALETLAPTEANGKALVQLLDERAFDDLITDDGGLTRELAVATLLRLGYPWALQVHPDELAWYRASIADRSRNRRLLVLLGILGLELAVWATLYLTF